MKEIYFRAPRPCWLFFPCVLLLPTVFLCNFSVAQELAPRAYWPTPNGTNVFVLGYQLSTGDIVTDVSLPVTGVDSRINYLQPAYQRTFSLYGRTATLQVSAPFSDGVIEGFVNGEPRRRSLSGMGDARMQLAVNLLGAPSMDATSFLALRANPRPIVGASLLIQAPTGEYETDKLINLGTNRWSIKSAIGVIWPIRPGWLLEFEVGAWFFGDNDEFLNGTREQEPVLSSQIHLIRRIKAGFWVSLDANFYVGGRTTTGTTTQDNLQRNSRFGATVLVPIKGRHALRSSYSTGIATESGGDYDILSLSYVYAW